MNLDRYPFETSFDYFQYEFRSYGPKGSIKKIVRFDEFTTQGVKLINLAFGDWNEVFLRIDDEVISNNEDAEKILATVAFIVVDFTNRFPKAILYAEGSNRARNRKYQMALNRQYEDISELFKLFGVNEDGTVEPFRKNINYTGFLATRKL